MASTFSILQDGAPKDNIINCVFYPNYRGLTFTAQYPVDVDILLACYATGFCGTSYTIDTKTIMKSGESTLDYPLDFPDKQDRLNIDNFEIRKITPSSSSKYNFKIGTVSNNPNPLKKLVFFGVKYENAEGVRNRQIINIGCNAFLKTPVTVSFNAYFSGLAAYINYKDIVIPSGKNQVYYNTNFSDNYAIKIESVSPIESDTQYYLPDYTLHKW